MWNELLGVLVVGEKSTIVKGEVLLMIVNNTKDQVGPGEDHGVFWEGELLGTNEKDAFRSGEAEYRMLVQCELASPFHNGKSLGFLFVVRV